MPSPIGVSTHGALFVLELAHTPEPESVSGVSVRELLRDDIPALEDAMQASGVYSQGIAQRRYSEDRRPYGVETDGKIVTYGWAAYTPEPIGNLGISFRLEPNEVYIYDCATRPEYQGRGYYKTLLRFMALHLRRRGCWRIWIGIEPGNVASQRGILGAGFTMVAYISTRRINGVVRPEVYGVRGISAELVTHAAWCFEGEVVSREEE
ncbi:MAG: hypothetical protein NVSMB52_14880 [Chloroflexota bacterium]